MTSNNNKLASYLNVAHAYGSQMIPKINKFTFISNITGLPQVWTLDKNNNPVQFSEFEERVLSVNHSPNGDQTLIGVDYKGNEKQQLYIIENITGGIDSLEYNPKCFHYIGGWSPDGRQITFSSNYRNPGFFDVFTQCVDTKEKKKVFEYDGVCEPLGWTLDGENIFISIAETNIDNSIYILNLISGNTTKVGKENVLASYSSIELTKDQKGGYLLTDAEEETVYVGWFAFEQPDKIEKVHHVLEWDVEELKLSPNEKYISFTINEGGLSRLTAINIEIEERITWKNIPSGVINSISWAKNDQLIFTLKTPTMPGDIWSQLLTDKDPIRLTNISQSKEVEHLWVEPKLCIFESFDGEEIPYFLYEKTNTINKPAVIYVHGGPESQIRREYNPVIQYLVERGFAVVAPNVRGSSGYGRSYIKLDDGKKRMDSVKDLAWLVEDLIDSHGVNGEKIGIVGRSYGGFMVLAALTHYPNLWNAAVNIVGISHFTTFLQNTGPWRRHLREYEYGSLKDNKEFFEEVSPLNHSHSIQAPLLVFHGRNDTRVPISEAEQLVTGMNSRNQTVKFIIFEDEGHTTEKVENQIVMHSETVNFFEQYLLN